MAKGEGAWVAFYEKGGGHRTYLLDAVTGLGATSPAPCVRFDSEAEALRAADSRWGRIAGCRVSAAYVPRARP